MCNSKAFLPRLHYIPYYTRIEWQVSRNCLECVTTSINNYDDHSWLHSTIIGWENNLLRQSRPIRREGKIWPLNPKLSTMCFDRLFIWYATNICRDCRAWEQWYLGQQRHLVNEPSLFFELYREFLRNKLFSKLQFSNLESIKPNKRL